MNKHIKSALTSLKALLAEESGSKTMVNTESGDQLQYDKLEVGGVLYDADGNIIESREYKLEDGMTIVVDNSIIAEVKEAEAVTEEIAMEQEEPKDDKEEVKEELEVEEPKEEPQSKDLGQQVAELVGIDLTADGYHSIVLEVANGKIIWGDVMSDTWKTLLSKQEEAESKVQELETKLANSKKLVESLEVGLAKQEDVNLQKPIKEEKLQTKLSKQSAPKTMGWKEKSKLLNKINKK
jgi:hypothetical protein